MSAAPEGTRTPERSPAAFDRLTRAAARLLGVPIALVTMVEPGRQRFASAVGLPEPVAARGETPLSHSFCKHVAATAEPLVVHDAREHPLLFDNPAIADLGVVAYVGYPLFSGGAPVGAFCAMHTEPHRWSREDVELLEDLAGLAQAQLDQAALTAAAQAAREAARREQAEAEAATDMLRRLVDLMDVTRDAEDLGALLHLVARTAADALGASAAAIALRDDDGELRVRALAGLPQPAGGASPVRAQGFLAAVLEEGRVVAIPQVTDRDPMGGWLHELGLAAVLGAPLRDGGRITGVIGIADRGPREWTELEAQLLRLAAGRLAGAFERARADDAARDVADRLQRALEPTRLPEVPGVTLAARYRPAEGRIGGDWFDVFALSGGRIGLAIGDVVGHGIRAAAAAVRLRHHLRGLLLRRMGPGEAMRGLDAFVADEPDAAFSSVLYAELDLAAHTARWASAGHLPPVLLRGGAVTPLASPGGSLLGVVALDPWPEQTLALEAGDRLVLYTDGLVERPGVPIDEDIAATFATVGAEPELERLCHRLVAGRALPERDDVAVLVAAVG